VTYENLSDAVIDCHFSVGASFGVSKF